MSPPRILLVEDEQNLARALKLNLITRHLRLQFERGRLAAIEDERNHAAEILHLTFG